MVRANIWDLKGAKGEPGYNATGAAEDDAAIAAFARGASGPTETSRALTELAGLNVRNFGAVGDGVADDTVAIQAAIDAAIPGQAIIFPPSGSTNEFYRITSGLVVTTPSLRFIGQPRDAYSVSIRCATPGITVLTVKQGGFVMQDMHLMGVENLADGGANGAGMTVTGMELFGNIRGDIDAKITGCTFQYMAVGIRVRARNAQMQDNVFSHCLNGVTLDGIDVSYHTDPAAVNQNRGNQVEGCRFHNVGAATTDAAIDVTPEAGILHAIIKSNFFDSWTATSVRAVGTSAKPHQQIDITGNKHTELLGVAYDLTWVENSEIAGGRVYGPIAGQFTDDAIRLTNCTNVTVDDAFAYRVGKSAMVMKSCTDVEVRGLRARSVGLAAVGHGIDCDSSNSNIRFDNVSVTSGSGWGFTGEPVASAMTGSDFRSMTLGRINSLTLQNTASVGTNTFTESKFGRLEDTGRKTVEFAAGVSKTIATVLGGGNFSTFALEVEYTARGTTTSACYLFTKRYVQTENGSPVATVIGTDAANRASITITAFGTQGITIAMSTVEATQGTVTVRASSGGASNSVNPRGVVVAMS